MLPSGAPRRRFQKDLKTGTLRGLALPVLVRRLRLKLCGVLKETYASAKTRLNPLRPDKLDEKHIG